ncbi:MAG: alanine--glyoxylate aminotransferase family protein [Candidatus Gastranaerophilales bacterium]|nr:alanine--glyoxylate aminotransferase family protein [Candidatus Gastranaerophilales bacterium]
MQDKEFLMIPGPTPVPQSVLLALAKHPIGHRSKEFSTILRRVEEGLKWVFQTKYDVHIYTSSGTGAMCSAMGNLVNEGDRVLCLIIGNFGRRWAKIAKSRGADVIELEVPYGKAIDPCDLEKVLKENDNIKIVTMTHNETSTGVTNPVKELVKLVKNYGALSVVDGITSLGAINCPMDEWGIDVLVSGSQKGFMIPPGLAFLAANDRAFEMHKQCKYPDFYFNWTDYKKNLDKDTTPWTPAVNLVVALDEALSIMKQTGLNEIFELHKSNAKLLREGLKDMGLKLFVEDENIASYAITSVLPPEGVLVPDIRRVMKEKYDITVANGQNDLKDKIFRMGTLGFVSRRDVLTALASLKETIEGLKK